MKKFLLFLILITLLTGCQNNNIQTAKTETDSMVEYTLEVTSPQTTESSMGEKNYAEDYAEKGYFEINPEGPAANNITEDELPTKWDIIVEPPTIPEDPIEALLHFLHNKGAFEYYLYDFTKDGYPEVLIESNAGLQSNTFLMIQDVVKAPYEDRGNIVYTRKDDPTKYTMEHYYDLSKNADLYYNTVVEHYNKPFYHVNESCCWYKDGMFLEFKGISHGEQIPKEDEVALAEHIGEIRKGLEQYEFIEYINLDVIHEWEVYVDACEDILKNYGRKEPSVDIQVNGTVQTYPWNTYRFEITEDFDWSELNKLPNLKFVKVDLKNPNADYEKLKVLKTFLPSKSWMNWRIMTGLAR